MIMEVKLWVALSVIGILTPLVMYAGKWAIDQITSKLDQIIKQNAEFNSELVRHNSEIVNMKEDIKINGTRLNDHADRLREIELDHAKCNYPRRSK